MQHSSGSQPRRIALPVQKIVKEKLKTANNDIITEVHAPTNSCAPIVAVPKDNGGVRICVDLTEHNESVTLVWEGKTFPCQPPTNYWPNRQGQRSSQNLIATKVFIRYLLHKSRKSLQPL
ncbi:transposon Ty3-G Gag-Pol polyprotein [Elysia marginata]|uniref:Transposon Ty3-G Gag-Pol polyprotein n=1 Tax=Elysia marginata TaxID=1093978 RepID=A0AAV4JF36_9GAST|nr:transposon Ty3-G Gag-Pol polyprotein [Elysia marginata]